jgi:hypothetical protein
MPGWGRIPPPSESRLRPQQQQRITAPALLADGDHIRICEHEFTFEINPTGG